MKSIKTISFGIFSVIVGIILLLQFIDTTIETIQYGGSSILLEPYEGELTTTQVNYDLGMPIGDLPEPSMSGHVFLGWYYDKNFINPIEPGDVLVQRTKLYAKYEVLNYTITFTDQTQIIDEMTIAYGDPIIYPEDPIKYGYSFLGWYVSSEETVSFQLETMPDENIILYARWQTNQYTITFNSNGGSIVSPITQLFNANIPQPSVPVKTGYTFDGWYREDTLENKYFFPTMPGENVTLYAKWVINHCNIIFMTNGGTPVYPITQNYGTVITSPPSPTKEGYTFDGWYSDIGLTQVYTFNTMPAQNILILYAKWTINQYTISFNSNGGSSIASITQNYNSLLLEPSDPSRVGYNFAGWYTDLTFTKSFIFNQMPAKNVTLYARWLFNEYKVEFIDYNGTVLATSNHVFGASLADLIEPTPQGQIGHTFIDWDRALPATMPAANITVIALYQVNSYEIEFVDHNGAVLQTSTHLYGSDITDVILPTNPTRTGYTFSEWDSVLPSTMPANDLIVTATYTINQYTITFNSNGGSLVTSITQNYNTSVSAPSNPTKTGYMFSGWYSDAGLTTPFTFTTMPAQNMTLYAKWSIIQYTISFNSNGGTAVTPIFSQEGQAIVPPVNPTKSGYTFAEWYTDQALTNPFTFTTTPPRNFTLYAKWTINQYQLIYRDYNGTILKTTLYNYGANISNDLPPANPSRTGYTFNSWDTLLPSTMPASDLYLTATYQINTYEISFKNYNGTVLQTSTHVYGSDISGVTPPANPSRTGYTFSEWDVELSSTMPANNIILTAAYTINQYTITFNSNGGSLVTAITQDYNTSVSAPSDPTKTGYTFAGWYSDAGLTTPYSFSTMPAQNITLYAKWTINQYTISYSTDGGLTYTTVTQDYNTTLETPADPTRIGFTFDGWYSDAGYTTPYIFGSMSSDDINIYVKWNINQYTITFNSNGGSLITAITQDYNTSVSAPSDPTKMGYTFAGWYSDAGLTTLYSFSTMPAENLTLYAKWTINQYTISYSTDGGLTYTTVTQDYNTTLETPDDPTRIGFTFDGWYSDAGYTTPYIFGLMSSDDINIYVKWNVNQYTITFNSNGGSSVTSITQDYDTSVSAPSEPTKTGYTFAGWYGDEGLTSLYSFNTMPAENFTLYAKWTINQYTITFNSNGGSLITAITQNYDSTVSEPSNPTKTGYTFAGWYSDAGLTTSYTFTTMPAQNFTLYAKWTVNQYQITYKDINGSLLQSSNHNYGSDISGVTPPVNPSRTGYTFSEWDSVLPSTMPANNIILTATYTINQYTISYSTDGGLTYTTVTQDYNTTLETPDNPTRIGFTFDGWYSDAGYTTPYIFGLMSSDDINIYVKWNVGSLVTSITQDYNTSVSAPSNPTRTGYTFAGWYSDAGLTTLYSFSTMPAQNITLYAKWTINQYTITFNSNGGTAVSSMTQTYNTSVSSPSDPTRTGYTFAGWYSDAGFTTPYTFSTMPAHNITLFAKWTVNQYQITYKDIDGSVLHFSNHNYGSDISGLTPPANPTRTGYTFSEWDSVLPSTMPANSIILTATYTINQYTITFNSNGGTALSSITQNYDSTISEPSDPTRTGYTFNGWY
ncbi:MAG: hypothetical protein CVV56_08390 [Tenericutes bacterium HGW-Tenericutes-1]|nr:MAG: hypothetical protein CVV56_08390 [Tenericutes bacterium HGW-Tenericutes-1]